jgi:signal transduction histidine kinase
VNTSTNPQPPHGSLPPLTWLARQRRWVIIAMMVSLHFALVLPPESMFSRVWLMVHFGLFLIWQPFVSGERELNVIATALLLGITAVVMTTLSGWMLVTWVSLLIAIMGGKVFTSQAARRSRFYLVAVFYLFVILLSWTVPISLLDIGKAGLPEGMRTLAYLIVPMVLIAMAFLPFRAEDEHTTQVFDFFYSIFVFQLVVVLVLGSLAAMRVTGNQYFPAVALTVLSFASALLLLAILWGPRAGFGGLRTYFSRYLMTVGMPFELWMRRIAELSEAEMLSQRFLSSAMEEVATLPWILGARWKSPDLEAGEFGRTSAHSATFRYHDLEITFYTEIDLSPALFLHVRLLAQVIGEFYEGKRREQAMKQNAYMQAVHETGARLTHDIKNLLQSIIAITSASSVARERRHPNDTRPDGQIDRRTPSPFEQMIERQLPQLTQRLQTTLDKLRNPETAAANVILPAAQWWRDVKLRHQASGLTFIGDSNMLGNVVANVFDAVLENCLENARKKREREPDIRILVELVPGDTPELRVADTGSPIPQTVIETLFLAPVGNSRSGGLGIGLYQATQLAIETGFRFTLDQNVAGNVCFKLAKQSPE